MGKELAHFLNKKGKQGPIRQHPDFREAKHAYRHLSKEHAESTSEGNESIHPAQQTRQHFSNNLKVLRGTTTQFTLELDGNMFLQQVRLHPRSGSRTMNGSRIKVEIIGDLQPRLNSKMFKVEIKSTGRPAATTRSDSDSLCLLFR